jgi:hypothetical protein
MESDPLADRLRELEARDAIAQTIALYGQLLDDRRFDEFGDLFAVDGVWAIPGMTLNGRHQIVEVLRELERGGRGSVKHVSLLPVIVLDGLDRAQAWTDLLTLVPAEGGWRVVATGRYYDTFVHADGCWRFATRTAEVHPTSALARFVSDGSLNASSPGGLPPPPVL